MDISSLKVSTLELASIINSSSDNEILSCFDLYPKIDGTDNKSAAHLFSCITTMMLDPTDTHTPLKPFLDFGESHSTCTGDFDNQTLFCMAALTSNISNHDLRARVSDLVWCRKAGGLGQAHLAVSSYIESAKLLILKNEPFDAVSRIERALRLSYTLRKAPKSNHGAVTNYILELLSQSDLIEQPVQIIRLACEFGIEDDNLLYAKAIDIANSLFKRKEFRRAIMVLEVAHTCAVSMRDKEKEYSVNKLISSYHETEADYSDSPISVGCLMSALTAIRRTPNSKLKQTELFTKIRSHQRELKYHMHEFVTSSGDMSSEVARSKKIAVGQDMYDCIFRLALCVTAPTNINKLRATVEKTMRNSIFADLGADQIDHEGMTVAKIPGLGSKEDTDNTAIENHLMTMLRADHTLMARAYILPATEEISNNFYFDKEVLTPFLTNNPFIPSDHREYFARGLTAGMHGDFLTSSHLLIPQIENSLRYALEGMEEEPTRIYGDGDQERDGLKSLLENELLINEFGDLLYHLKAILINKVYGDLRNQVSHGYIPSTQINSEASITLWWLVLRIVVLPYRKYLFEKYGEKLLSEQSNERARTTKGC